jgi:hypothetical protein
MARKNTVSISIEVSPEQRDAITRLAMLRDMNKSQLIRTLLADECNARAIHWPDNVQPRGTYERNAPPPNEAVGRKIEGVIANGDALFFRRPGNDYGWIGRYDVETDIFTINLWQRGASEPRWISYYTSAFQFERGLRLIAGGVRFWRVIVKPAPHKHIKKDGFTFRYDPANGVVFVDGGPPPQTRAPYAVCPLCSQVAKYVNGDVHDATVCCDIHGEQRVKPGTPADILGRFEKPN